MKYELLLNVLTVLEIIAVEFVSIWTLSKKKHGFPAALGTYVAITAPLLLFMCLVATRMSGYGNGSGKFMFLGVFYFIPAMVNYGGDWRSRGIIAFYSFSYGLGGFAVAVRISYLFGEEKLSLVVFLAQTLLYAATLPVYLRFSRSKVVVYIQKADRGQKNLLLRYTITSFILIIMYNNTMVVNASMLRKLVIYLLLIYFIILTYRLMVSYLKAGDDVQELNELARTDRLTGLGNRLALRDQAEAMLRGEAPFFLLFLDLNDFKSVNDRFGHVAGDVYLRRFSQALSQCAGPDSPCFRLSGDEFICLTRDEGLYARLRELALQAEPGEPEFQGVAVGQARFPDEARDFSTLLDRADRCMYAQKLNFQSAAAKKPRRQ